MTRVSPGFLDYQRYAKMERAREGTGGGWFVIFRGEGAGHIYHEIPERYLWDNVCG